MGNYYYLISTLPLLKIGEPPPFSEACFLEECARWLSSADLDALTAFRLAPLPAKGAVSASPLQASWLEWESALRNALVKIRASNLDRDPEKSLRPAAPTNLDTERGAAEAVAITDPLQREKALDHARWRRLDELEFLHDFDLQRLCVYKLKLLLCHKWVPRTQEKGKANLDAAIDELEKGLHLAGAAA